MNMGYPQPGRKTIVALCAAGAITIGWGARAQESPADPVPRLTVIGEGSVEIVPDMALLTLGVQSEDESAADAMDAAGDVTGRIMAALADAGIEARDIQTSGLSLSPVYPERYDDTPRVATRYRAASDLNVRVRDLDMLGGVIDAAATAGGNSFGGLRFALADPRPAEDDARRAAIEDARAKAELFATAAGQTLDGVIQIDEQRGGGGGPSPMMADAAMRSAVPVAEGTLDVRAGVRMVFRLAPIR